MIVPRSTITYPIYGIGGILPLNLRAMRKSSLMSFFVLMVFLSVSFLVNGLLNKLSLTAFILQVIMTVPFFLFALGFKADLNTEEILKVLRFMNVALMIFSFINLVRDGFPYKLPYRDYLPDEYFGLYFTGGARIITLIGFFGLAAEIANKKLRKKRYLLVDLINFLVPSYITGIACGIAGYSFLVLRKPRVLLATTLLMILPMYYAYVRLGNLNNTFMSTFGHHPKILAYLTIGYLYTDNPVVALLGTGLGQFTGTAALWGSTAIQAISTQSAGHIPGLFTSDYHNLYMAPYLAIGIEKMQATSSVLNKPYTSFSTIFCELGLVVSFILFYLIYMRFRQIRKINSHAYVLMLFGAALFTLDQWHDSYFFAFLLLLMANFQSDPLPQTDG